jgi:spore coat protein U-like protein
MQRTLIARALVRAALVAAVWLMCPSTASAQSSCTISVTSIAFGNYNVFTTTADDSTGTITFRCNAAARNISISLSDGSSSTFSPRTMRKSSEVLQYNLYRNAARTTLWGDGTGGTSVYTNSNPPNNRNVNVTIYARIPAQQDVSAGSYSDTVSAVINF